MKSLGEKEAVKSTEPKKALRFVFVVLAAVLAVVIIVCGILIFAKNSGEDSSAPSSETSSVSVAETKSPSDEEKSTIPPEKASSEEASTEEASQHEVLVTYENFRLQALMATAKLGFNELWNPEKLILTHENDSGWSAYSCDTNIPEADLRIFFYNDGEEILTVISDVTDETFSDAVDLYECILSGIVNYTFINYRDMMTDRDIYPMQESEAESSFLEDIGFPDQGYDKTDEGTSVITEYRWIEIDEFGYWLYELRTRTYNGVTYYDMFMYNTLE